MPPSRPRVVVYVTREEPLTGADQLLVFDLPDEPAFSSVVPGGRIEPGETAAEAAVRELREETGLEVEVVRELGVEQQPSWRVPGLRDENHFLQATPKDPTPGAWDHDVEGDVFRCRWVALTNDTRVYSKHGAFLPALIRKRVVAYVTRGRELLVFNHRDEPGVPTQVPAGRVDHGESLEQGVVREVEEETGLRVRVVAELAGAEEVERLYGALVHESHAFHALSEPGGPEAWEHHVSGGGMDSGFVFACRWVPLDDCPPLWGKPDPLVERLRRSIPEP
jgi:ADP-ribose pyrophosphatase YjhB (NUDIX family)